MTNLAVLLACMAMGKTVCGKSQCMMTAGHAWHRFALFDCFLVLGGKTEPRITPRMIHYVELQVDICFTRKSKERPVADVSRPVDCI